MKRFLILIIAAAALSACTADRAALSASDVASSLNEEPLEEAGSAEHEERDILILLNENCEKLRRLNARFSSTDNSVRLKNTTESGRILYVEETDTTFWTDNEFLYQKTGSESFALAKGVIYSLSLNEGRLYFIRSDKSAVSGPLRGEPFCYNLNTGELISLSDKVTTTLFVCDERIFLKHWESLAGAEGEEYRYYYCEIDKNGETIKRRDDLILCADGAWYVTCRREGESFNVYYVNEAENTESFVAAESNPPRMACINGDYLYYVESGWGNVFKRAALDGSGTEICANNDQYIYDYVFIGGLPALYTDSYFGIVDTDMNFQKKRIFFDNAWKIILSLYMINGNVLGSFENGYQFISEDAYGNIVLSDYNFN